MVVNTRARLSANPFACRACHFLFDNCEPFRVHIARRLYPAIALTGHTLEAVIAVWVVTWHLLVPVLKVLFLAAMFRVCCKDCHTLLDYST
jgi:hypothetical protein